MELDELYQNIILDHSRRPRNAGTIENATAHARGDNPSCGDEIEVFLKINTEGKIDDIKFSGQGCAISQASASLMTLKIKNKTCKEAFELLTDFNEMILGGEQSEPPAVLGDLRILKGVRKFPQRVKCATLAWQALRQALQLTIVELKDKHKT